MKYKWSIKTKHDSCPNCGCALTSYAGKYFMCSDCAMIELDNRESTITRQAELIRLLREDGDRLVTGIQNDEFGDYCAHCGNNSNDWQEDVVHKPDCPITLHNQLKQEREG